MAIKYRLVCSIYTKIKIKLKCARGILLQNLHEICVGETIKAVSDDTIFGPDCLRFASR